MIRARGRGGELRRGGSIVGGEGGKLASQPELFPVARQREEHVAAAFREARGVPEGRVDEPLGLSVDPPIEQGEDLERRSRAAHVAGLRIRVI